METKESPPNKEEAYKALFKGEPEAIFILSGGVKDLKSEETGRVSLSSTAFSDENLSGMLGGKARVIAAAEVASYFPNAKIVTTSRDNQHEETHAQVMADELLRYKVPKDQIVKEENSVSTLTELTEMIKIARARGWLKLAVLSNDWHLPRMQKMYERASDLASSDNDFIKALGEFKEMGGEVNFVAAEAILPLRNRRYEDLIELAEDTKPYKKRLAFEERGLKDLEDGEYKKTDPNSNLVKDKGR